MIEPNWIVSAIIFSMLAGGLVFFIGYSRGQLDPIYKCSICNTEFKDQDYYEWHLISFCETQCMDEECPYREELGWEHSVKHHENPL